jgi:hypothetical protein
MDAKQLGFTTQIQFILIIKKIENLAVYNLAILFSIWSTNVIWGKV